METRPRFCGRPSHSRVFSLVHHSPHLDVTPFGPISRLTSPISCPALPPLLLSSSVEKDQKGFLAVSYPSRCLSSSLRNLLLNPSPHTDTDTHTHTRTHTHSLFLCLLYCQSTTQWL